MKQSFVKMQGLGNDFILLEGSRLPKGVKLPELAQQVCDRHLGIGADGLILAWPARLEAASARMQIFNADGSEPEMCGNGLRCFARYLADQRPQPVPELVIETAAGLRQVRLGPTELEVNMGLPILEPEALPALGFGNGPVIQQALEAEGQRFEVTLVSMGNPHCVIQVPSLATFDFAHWGPRLERHPAFPARINLEFVEVLSPERAQVKVWERGAGATQACGTGACAVLVAGVLGGWLDHEAEMGLPGGDLTIAWEGLGQAVWMRGPAQKVFDGEIELEAET